MKEGWEYKKLGEVCQIERGGSPRPIKDYVTDDTNGINWIKIGDTDKNGKYIYSTKEKIKPAGLKKSRWVEENDFLLSNSMSYGRPYILKTKGCIHDGWLVLRNYQATFIMDFLYYLLVSPTVQFQFKAKAQGSTVSNLNTDRVSKVVVAIPDKDEQQRIVSYLDSAFAKIDAVAKNAEKSLNEAKALFQSALTKMMEPKEGWEKKKLKEVCAKITDGTHNSPINYHKGDYMYVTAKNIKEQGLDLSDITYVSKDVHEEIYARCNPEYGDVLYIKDGATAGIAIVNPLKEEFSLLSSVALLKPEHNIINGRFLCYALNSSYTQKILQSQMDGAAIRRVTLKKIKEFHLAFPTLNEQEYIVERLDSIKKAFQTLSSNLTRTLSECAALKQSILRQTFE